MTGYPSVAKRADAKPRRPSGTSTASAGLTAAQALAVVLHAEGRLWTPEEADVVKYLHGRGLTDETIRQEILAANARFYRALVEADLAAMIELWHHSPETECIHPGWDRLRGWPPSTPTKLGQKPFAQE